MLVIREGDNQDFQQIKSHLLYRFSRGETIGWKGVLFRIERTIHDCRDYYRVSHKRQFTHKQGDEWYKRCSEITIELTSIEAVIDYIDKTTNDR